MPNKNSRIRSTYILSNVFSVFDGSMALMVAAMSEKRFSQVRYRIVKSLIWTTEVTPLSVCNSHVSRTQYCWNTALLVSLQCLYAHPLTLLRLWRVVQWRCLRSAWGPTVIKQLSRDKVSNYSPTTTFSYHSFSTTYWLWNWSKSRQLLHCSSCVIMNRLSVYSQHSGQVPRSQTGNTRCWSRDHSQKGRNK